MTLNEFLDCNYGADGDDALRKMLDGGADPNRREGLLSEASLHVATRRRRANAVEILLDRGADIDAQTAGGKTAYAHAVGRGFDEVAESLRLRGASTLLNHPDHLAVALRHWRVGGARRKNDHRHR